MMTLEKIEIKRFFKRIIVPFVYHRKIHAYGVGHGKTGTISMEGLFKKNYRAVHEPEIEELIQFIIESDRDNYSDSQKEKYVRKRDKNLWFELDSSVLNIFILDQLVNCFPNAKFILTIRDCYSWLDSTINYHSPDYLSPLWMDFLQWMLRPRDFNYSSEENILQKNNRFPVECYLTSWATHNQSVIDKVPSSRLLIVKTREIGERIPEIASFLDVPLESLDKKQSHLHKSDRKINLLSQLDKDFIEKKVEMHCRELMDAYFPEIRSINDVFPN